MADLVDAQLLGCASSPSASKASSSKKHHTVDPLSRNSRLLRALLFVGREHRALVARLPGIDDLDRPLAQASLDRGGDEILDDEESVRGGRLLPDPDRARPDRTVRAVGSLRDVDLTVLGSTVRHPIDHVEVFPAPANVTSVRFTNDEVTSMCPVTQQPDLSTVVIEYVPGSVVCRVEEPEAVPLGVPRPCRVRRGAGRRDRRRDHGNRAAGAGHGHVDAAPARRHRAASGRRTDTLEFRGPRSPCGHRRCERMHLFEDAAPERRQRDDRHSADDDGPPDRQHCHRRQPIHRRNHRR